MSGLNSVVCGLCVIAVLGVSTAANAASCKKSYRVSAGILKHYKNRRTGKPDVRIRKYTYRIPYYQDVQLNPDYFGAIIRPRHKRTYTVAVTYEIPYTDKINKKHFLSVSHRGKRLILEEKPVTLVGKGVVRMRLSDGDKTGIYKVRVRVNKRLCRVIPFRIYKRK